jgi:hypothetical protein
VRIQLRALAPTLLGTVALHTMAHARNGDPGASSLSDLSIDDDGGGLLAFGLNAGFALVFIVVALLMARRAPRPAGSARRARSNITHVTQGIS